MTDSRDRELSELRKEIRILSRRLEQCQRNRKELGYVKDKLDHVLVREEDARLEIERKSAELSALNQRLDSERRRSDELLASLLPGAIVDELRANGRVEARVSECATVLFADFIDFGKMASSMRAADLVAALDHLFSDFDRIVAMHGLEPLKTMGDSFRCVGGLPGGEPRANHAADTVNAAIEMIRETHSSARRMAPAGLQWVLRVGIHTGPLVSGVVGHRKLTFDVWGETVSLASRFKEASEPGQINVSRTTADACGDMFALQRRGWIEVKNRGPLEMFFIESRHVSFVQRRASSHG